MRKLKLAGCGDATTARPGGGPGGGVQEAVFTPTAIAFGLKLMLPENLRLLIVPHGFPCVPIPPQIWTCSPAIIVVETPSGMAATKLSFSGGFV
jgi:hypothetical protein